MVPLPAFALILILLLLGQCPLIFGEVVLPNVSLECVPLLEGPSVEEDEEYDQLSKQREEYFGRRDRMNRKVLDAPEIDFWFFEEGAAPIFFDYGQKLASSFFAVRSSIDPLPANFISIAQMEEATVLWYYPYILKKARFLDRLLGLNAADYQDLLQELMTALSRAVRKYDAHKEYSFQSYLNLWLRSAEDSYKNNYMDKIAMAASSSTNAANGQRYDAPYDIEVDMDGNSSEWWAFAYFIPDTDFLSNPTSQTMTREISLLVEQAFEVTLNRMERTQEKFADHKETYYLIFRERIKPYLDAARKGLPATVPTLEEMGKRLGKAYSTVVQFEQTLKRKTIQTLIEDYAEELVSFAGEDAVLRLGTPFSSVAQRRERAAAQGQIWRPLDGQKGNTFRSWATHKLKELPPEELENFRRTLYTKDFRFLLDTVYLQGKPLLALRDKFGYAPNTISGKHKIFRGLVSKFLAARGIERPAGL